MKYRKLLSIILIVCLLIMGGTMAFAQRPSKNWDRWLDDEDDYMQKDGMDLEVFRERVEKTITVEPGVRIVVDASEFGGIRVRGWERNEIEVVARKKTAAITEEEARALAQDVEILVKDRWKGNDIEIYSDGPRIRDETFWSVSFDVSVPEQSDLLLETKFGGIVIDNVHGDLRFYAEFGGIDLSRVSGRVLGETKFGSVMVDLDGKRWDGDRLEVSTQFGGVTAYVPGDYAADLEAGTSFGSLSVDFPITVQGRLFNKEIRTRLGGGGAPIQLTTQFGSVEVRKR